MESFVLCCCPTFHYKIPAWCVKPKASSLSAVLAWKACTSSQNLVPPARRLDVVEALFFFFFPDGKAGRGGTELTFLGREAQRGVGWEVLARGLCRALAVQCSGRYLLPDGRWRAEGINL